MRTATVGLKVSLIFKPSLTFTARVLVVTAVFTHVTLQSRLSLVLLVTLCAREWLLVVFYPDVLDKTRLFHVRLCAVRTRELLSWFVAVLRQHVTVETALACELETTCVALWLLVFDTCM